MNYIGKILGALFGFLLGGPVGLIIGLLIGHFFDSRLRLIGSRPGVQQAFFTALFSVLGHISKADGRVNEDEIRLANEVMAQMRLPEPLRQRARELFRHGKEPGFSLDAMLDEFIAATRLRPELSFAFVEILLQAAHVDGNLHRDEERILRFICERLGFPPGEFERLDRMVRAAMGAGGASGQSSAGMGTEWAYGVLGCGPDSSDAEVRKRYRTLMNRHHPDKLIAKGMPEEMVRLASERTVEIRKAYDILRAARGF
jgi:DnaJ like chaperone protein